MGTYVFPDADYKFYLDADPVVIAERRSLQLTQTLGMKFNPQKILEEIIRINLLEMNQIHEMLLLFHQTLNSHD